MKIALLAPEEAGKTCYLSSLFGELTDLINFSKETAPLSFSFIDTDTERLLGENYSILLNGTMPPSTRINYNIPVQITHRTNNITTTIGLFDFPGGRLRSIGTRQEVESVISLLSDCDAFIILIDAAYAGVHEKIFRERITASKINEILREVIIKKRDSKFATHGISFIFAISKVDKINCNTDVMLSAYDNIKGAFSECFREEVNVVSCVTQVSIGNNIDGEDVNKKKGEYYPKNIVEPFFLALGIGTLSGAKYQHKERDNLKTAKERAYGMYLSEKTYTGKAKSKLDTRQSKSIFGKMEDFLFDGFETETDLKKLVNKYQGDEDAAWSKYYKISQELDEKISNIDNLRNIGATALAQIEQGYFDGESPHAVMYWRGKEHRLKADISCEIATPLEAL